MALPAAAAGAPPVAPLPPLSVPALTETFLSPEGFAFNFPADWVVAFDRSGSSNDGAVIGTVRLLHASTMIEKLEMANVACLPRTYS